MRSSTPLLSLLLLLAGCTHAGSHKPARSVSLSERPPTAMAAIDRTQNRDQALGEFRAGKYPSLAAAQKAVGSPNPDPGGEIASWAAGYQRALRDKVAQDKFEQKLDPVVAAMRKTGR